MKNIAYNKRISFDFDVIASFEAGIVLKGQEVKSIRLGNVNIRGAYASVKEGEVFISGFKISRFDKSSSEVSETRERKLLLHRKEIKKINLMLHDKGVTCMLKRIFLKRGLIKAEIVIARGRKKHDKRRVLKERSLEKEARKMMRNK